MLEKMTRPSRRSSYIIFLVILALWMLQTKTIHDSWNESSRLAAIESIVERSTWRIDASPYGHETGDKVLLDGHYYSDKPPLFAAIGAIFYAVMYYGLDARLAIDGCQPGSLCVYYWLTVLMVGVPSALLASLFYRLVRKQTGSTIWATGLTVLLCIGTVMWPYSLVFNHHFPAAVALFGGFYLLYESNPGRAYLFWAGFLASLAVMFDLTSIFLAGILCLMVIIYSARNILFFVGGGLIPLVATTILNYQITQSILFPYFFTQGYDYPGSPLNTAVGGLYSPDNLFIYTFRYMVGDHGVLAYSPLLIFAVVGLIQIIVQRQGPLSVKGALILLGIAGHLLFILTQTNNFGGDAYGGRHFIPFIPILFFFITFVVSTHFNKFGSTFIIGLGGIAALVSLFSAYQGVQATWHQVPPPFFWALSPNVPFVTAKTNLSLPNYQPTVRGNNDKVIHNFEVPAISHRLDANFNNELVLLGYDLPTRRVKPGQNLEITLYWQLLRVVRGDYFAFTHLLDDQSQTRWGGLDRRLLEGYPISHWYPGEVVVDQRQIPVESDAVNGLAWLRIGAYEFIDEQKIEPLPLSFDAGNRVETSLAIGPILIGTPSQVIDRNRLAPQIPLAIEWGEPPVILLRGYDLSQEVDHLQLVFYWESLAQTPTDWVIFVHLRNKAGEIVTQRDGPVGGGHYPTSLWKAGEIIVDKIVIPIENLPDDDYAVFIGLYDLLTEGRLSVADNPADEVLLIKRIGITKQ